MTYIPFRVSNIAGMDLSRTKRKDRCRPFFLRQHKGHWTIICNCKRILFLCHKEMVRKTASTHCVDKVFVERMSMVCQCVVVRGSSVEEP